MAIVFVATHTDRTAALVLVNSQARLRRAPDYPWGVPPGVEERVRASPVPGSFARVRRSLRWTGECGRQALCCVVAPVRTDVGESGRLGGHAGDDVWR